MDTQIIAVPPPPGASKYFILSKPATGDTLEIKDDQMVYINQKRIMIIPRDYISHHSLYGIYESSLMTWIEQEFSSKSKLFIDIGSHTGTFAINLSAHFKHIYAYEPQKMTYYALCGSVALSNMDNITCINVALGSQEQCNNGVGVLNIVSEDGGSSSLHAVANMPVLKQEIVQLRTMDSYCEIFKGEIGAIKIDTENNELEVLKGALKCLRESNYPTIFFENNYTEGEIFEFLQSLGYTTNPIRSYKNMYIAEKQ